MERTELQALENVDEVESDFCKAKVKDTIFLDFLLTKSGCFLY